jgi:hypothetical protein
MHIISDFLYPTLMRQVAGVSAALFYPDRYTSLKIMAARMLETMFQKQLGALRQRVRPFHGAST